MNALKVSLVELIRRTSAEIPDDVNRALVTALENEKKGTIAASALKIIEQNIELAKRKSQPICQDTGSVIFYVDCPVGSDQIACEEAAREAVKAATKIGYLRQNSVDSLTGKNDGTNLGPGAPTVHFHQHRSPEISVRLVLKGGGCENVGAQYSLPNEKLHANRDLDGCRKVILDAVLQAQGKGCGPGILGVCIGGGHEGELRAFGIFLIIDFGTAKILQAHGIDQQHDTVLLHRRVVFIDRLVERKTVLKSGAAAARDKDAQLEIHVAFFIDQLLHFGGRVFRKDERIGHFGHCVHAVLLM